MNLIIINIYDGCYRWSITTIKGDDIRVYESADYDIKIQEPTAIEQMITTHNFVYYGDVDIEAIEKLQDMGYVVLVCIDGTTDVFRR